MSEREEEEEEEEKEEEKGAGEEEDEKEVIGCGARGEMGLGSILTRGGNLGLKFGKTHRCTKREEMRNRRGKEHREKRTRRRRLGSILTKLPCTLPWE